MDSASAPLASGSTTEKAVKALVQHVAAKNAPKNELLAANEETISLYISLEKIPDKRREKPFLIPVPHSIYPEDVDICVFIKDSAKANLKDQLQNKHIQGGGSIKLLPVGKLRRNFKTAAQRRELCRSYDVFICDDRVVEMMPSYLGKPFFQTKKSPIPVKLTLANWFEAVENVKNSTILRIPPGPCCSVKIGRCNMDPAHIVANALRVIEEVTSIFSTPRFHNTISAISVKATDSVALPIYVADKYNAAVREAAAAKEDQGAAAASPAAVRPSKKRAMAQQVSDDGAPQPAQKRVRSEPSSGQEGQRGSAAASGKKVRQDGKGVSRAGAGLTGSKKRKAGAKL
ncbi:unnamed protein product [Vitrella brassicaformis CCMP3155]|uniref:Ribosomal protein L1 n=1 Tax=Vitrella brassicaformis (strain CCMP3155) TaxID=1169540 RepID=A0A0G4GSU8_VITBC|nr:unnamed protein product [Vitrella brassicaformis CCMP3155]|eukprot:CEM33711.1 unnamed protein product [Vitrella brassicaformis CCMP3155]